VPLSSRALSPQYTVSHSLDIPLPATSVWQTLTAWDQYPQWNPYLYTVHGEQRPGAELSISLAHEGKTLQVKPRLTQWRPGASYGWRGRALFYGLHETDHFFSVTATGPHSSRLRQWEEFRGFLPFLMKEKSARQQQLQQSFAQMNAALAARAQSNSD
jgi:hypothetical protein